MLPSAETVQLTWRESRKKNIVSAHRLFHEEGRGRMNPVVKGREGNEISALLLKKALSLISLIFIYFCDPAFIKAPLCEY